MPTASGTMNMYAESPLSQSQSANLPCFLNNISGSGSDDISMYIRSSDAGLCTTTQNYYFNNTPSSGDYTITISNQTTDNIAYDLSTNTIFEKIDNINNLISDMDGIGTESQPYILSFNGFAEELTINTDNLYYFADNNFTFTPSPAPGAISHFIDIDFDSSLVGVCRLRIKLDGDNFSIDIPLDSNSVELCNLLNSVMPFSSSSSYTTITTVGDTTTIHLDISSMEIASVEETDAYILAHPTYFISSNYSYNGQSLLSITGTTLFINGSGENDGFYSGLSTMNMCLYNSINYNWVDLFIAANKTDNNIDLYMNGVYNNSGNVTLSIPNIISSGNLTTTMFTHGY